MTPTEDHLCPTEHWQGAVGEVKQCWCGQSWRAQSAGPLDIRWVAEPSDKQGQIAARATYLNITQAELREREPQWFADELPDTERGLYGKYQVRRVDGKALKRAFVLAEGDPYAITALRAYADACERTHPLLAGDLRGWANEWSLGHLEGHDDG